MHGDRWPSFDERAELLAEAVEVMRKLFTGRQVSHRGRYYTVDNARLCTVPDEPPPIYVSGFGPGAAALAGRIGDGFVTMTPDHELVGEFHSVGGAGKPVIGGVKVCWSDDRDTAVDLATGSGPPSCCRVSSPSSSPPRRTSSRPANWSRPRWSARR